MKITIVSLVYTKAVQDLQIDGLMDGWMDGWMDEFQFIFCTFSTQMLMSALWTCITVMKILIV